MISTPAASTPVQRFLAPKQAAHWLSVSPKLLSKMRTSGGGPAFTYVGRLVRYSNAELGKWVTRQPRTGTKSGPAQWVRIPRPTALPGALPRTERDANHGVTATPSSNTTVWITLKTTTGFTLDFGTAAPAGATVIHTTLHSE